ncbi:MAG: hypothetical protein LBU84_00745 [Prevotella sp.]|jgi:hypothetical protein|nr:hypothetical protein [Prevotella sp.]
MRFRYYITGSGWAHLDIESGGKKFDYYDSLSMGGSLSDLLESILTVLNVKNDFPINQLVYNDETNKINWTIDEEGTTVEFNFEVNNSKDKAILKIIQHYENDECVLDEEIDFLEFIDEIINSCDIILNNYGIVGYFANGLHSGEFPITYYLLLKNYMQKEKSLKLETVFEKFDCYEEETNLLKTDINKELYLIKVRGSVS